MSPTRQRERELARARHQRRAVRLAAVRARRRRRYAIIGAVVVTALLIGGVTWLALDLAGDDKPARPAAARSNLPSPALSAKPFPPVPPGASPRLRGKPVVAPVKKPPPKLVRRDIIVGKGAAATPGRTLTVNYVGTSLAGKEFDSSWKAHRTFDVEGLGNAPVIKGWNQGLVGMKVGGRRELVIPANLAYGKQGSPPSIKPNQPLVFVIDLLAVR